VPDSEINSRTALEDRIERALRRVVQDDRGRPLTDDKGKPLVSEPQFTYAKEVVVNFAMRGLALRRTGKQFPYGEDSAFFNFQEKTAEVAARFKDEGLTYKDYIAIIFSRPALISLAPQTIEFNIRGLAAKFHFEGLTVKDYLAAACQQTTLFSSSPQTVAKNLRGVARAFDAEGLTLRDLLPAALKAPRLFVQSADATERHIRDLVKQFKNDGLTVSDYLHKAALKRPALFCRNADSVASRVRLIIDAYQKELVHFKTSEKTAPEDKPLKPVFDFMLSYPALLTYSNDNIYLRSLYAAVTGDRGQRRFAAKRHDVERGLREALGHPDAETPVEKIPDPAPDETVTPSYANNLLLRALIREGLMKGALAPQTAAPSRS
jgi:hypothetical protein